MQSLARWGFLDGSLTVLDYGCGRGDDVSALAVAGIDVVGWDPHFAPEAPLIESDVVNLGFVLNVIESATERAEALTSAYRLTRRVLSVAVMLNGNGAGSSHGDGVLTKRQTFQRYYTQTELRDYVAQVLERDPVTIAPGIVFVFRSDDDEQAFLARRQRSAAIPVDGFDMPIALQGHTARPALYERHQPLLDGFWASVLELGRLPFVDELDQGGELLAAAGSVRRAFTALPFADKERDVARVAAIRKDDLLVYLALNIFDRRASFGSIPTAVQRDVKAFFGSYKSALDHGHAALFEAGNAERTRAAAVAANDAHLGVLEADDSDYMFHASSIARQPATIRIILGCAERIEPQPADLDLIKNFTAPGSASAISRSTIFRSAPCHCWRDARSSISRANGLPLFFRARPTARACCSANPTLCWTMLRAGNGKRASMPSCRSVKSSPRRDSVLDTATWRVGWRKPGWFPHARSHKRQSQALRATLNER